MPAVTVPAGRVLTGNRELRRALRAAEMAVWEAARPATAPALELAKARIRTRILPPRSNRSMDGELLLLVLLAGSALAAVLFGILDISALLGRWREFVQGIHNLLA